VDEGIRAGSGGSQVIGYLEGTLAVRTEDGCFLDVNGVGYRLACSATTTTALPQTGERCRLFTYVHVREDLLALYGFGSEHEQRMFEALIGINGVGPKVALQVCSAFTPEAFRRVLVTDDVDVISSVPGIGKKTAQRIVLDLKEKLELPDLEVVGSNRDAISQARSALHNLGYSPAEVRVALSEVNGGGSESVEDMIKTALKVIGS
jgi:Holliday junction DNA helicase RuvA